MLTSLSHDHHQALRVCQLLRRCDEEDAQEIREGFEKFWEPHLRHLQIEETVLFPKYAECGGADDPMLARALTDHATIHDLADRVVSAAEPPVDLMHDLGDAINDHVRFEERELFPEIENAIPADEQPQLMQALDHAETGPGWQPSRSS